MKRLRQLLDGPEEDRGAALILVLFVVTVIGLAGAALLTFSDTSVRTTVALRDQAGNAYNADGAAQVAIESLSTGYGFASSELFQNANGTTCFGEHGGTLNLRDFYPAANGRDGNAPSSASVVCTADPATGVNSIVVPITAANRPGQAIMTLGKTSEVGINIETPSTSAFAVKGPVRSNSTIKVLTGALQSTAAVTALGACTGSIFSTPSKSCSLAANAVSDPGYASEATAVPAYRDVPADDLTSCPDGVVAFLPGYYDDAKSLTALMTGSGPCAGSTWWFKPGTYYFDFHNNTSDPDVYRGAVTASGRTANQWAITKGNLVAGTPTDGNGTAKASPGAFPTIPGSCQNPGRRKTPTGVQFIFGGDSQLAVGGSADAEICGTYHADRPPIALYGLKTGAATTTTLSGSGTGSSALRMSTVLSPGNFTNATQASLAELGGTSATWPKTSSGTETSTISMSGYAPPPATPIPAGSIVKTATIRVTHGNSKKYVAADRLAVTFTPKGVAGSPPGPDITPAGLTYPNSTGLVTNSLVVQAANATSPFGQYVHENGFTGADMAYAATLTHSGIESLDTIQIDISYVAPAFRSENIATISSNCINVTYTRTSSTACAVLSTSVSALPSFTGAFYIQGTTYTPLAAIDLTLNNAAQQVLRFGVISRSLWAKKVGAFSYPGPVIEMPDDAEGNDGAPIVILTVYVCPATSTSTCSTHAGATMGLRAQARIDDAEPPSKVTILSWSNLR